MEASTLVSAWSMKIGPDNRVGENETNVRFIGERAGVPGVALVVLRFAPHPTDRTRASFCRTMNIRETHLWWTRQPAKWLAIEEGRPVSIFEHRALSRRSLAIGTLGAAALMVVSTLGAPAQEKAVAPEVNPPGDIPDNQVFVTYASPLGFSIKAPEGWSRKESPDGVSFADKFGRVEVAISSIATPPTVGAVKMGEVAELEKNGRAVKIGAVNAVTLASGPAVRIAFTSNSEPNAVTGKQLRLESERFLIAHAGKLASVTFSAPAGADNADQWKLMSDSFRWK